jgi:hypothetical protein
MCPLCIHLTLLRFLMCIAFGDNVGGLTLNSQPGRPGPTSHSAPFLWPIHLLRTSSAHPVAWIRRSRHAHLPSQYVGILISHGSPHPWRRFVLEWHKFVVFLSVVPTVLLCAFSLTFLRYPTCMCMYRVWFSGQETCSRLASKKFWRQR